MSELREALSRPVVVITAPSGSGKTSAVSEWAEAAVVPVRWISAAEPADEFLQSFVRALSELTGIALGLSGVDPAGSIALTLSSLAASVESAAEGSRRQSGVLVVDDAHQAPSGLADLLELVRLTGTRSVLLSRSPLDLAAFEAKERGEDARIAWLDGTWLRFDRAEIASALDTHEEEDKVRFVEEQSEGWAVAVTWLAASDLRPVRGVRQLIEIPSQLAACFEEGILGGVPEDMRAELMAAAVPERVTDDCLSALRSDGGGRRHSLAELSRACPLLAPVAGTDGYRLQPLFRRFLLERLARREPLHLPDMHRRAMSWFADNQDDLGAISHAVLSGKPEVCLELLARVADRLVALHRIDELRQLAEAARPLWDRDPKASLLAAFAVARAGDGQLACRLVELAENSLNYSSSSPQARAQARAWAAWVRGEAALSMEQGSAALEIVDACLREQPGLEGLVLIGLSSVKGIAQGEMGAYDTALETLTRAEQAARAEDAVFWALRCMVARARVLRLSGALERVEAACHDALAGLGAHADRYPALAGKVYLELAEVHLARRDAAQACLAAEAAIRHLDCEHCFRHLAEAHETLARSRELLEDYAGALRAVGTGLDIARKQMIPVLARRLLALQENLELRHVSTFSGRATLDAASRSVSCGGRVISLTKREYEVLDYLRRQAGRWVPSEEIAQRVFRSVRHRQSTLVRVHIHAIRQKLGPARSLIESERGRGYRAPAECLSAN